MSSIKKKKETFEKIFIQVQEARDNLLMATGNMGSVGLNTNNSDEYIKIEGMIIELRQILDGLK